VAHVYNPRDSEGRDQEDCGSSPGKWFKRPYLEKKHHKKGAGGVGGAAQSVGPEFKLQCKKITLAFLFLFIK
jgi:hypothetical protein